MVHRPEISGSPTWAQTIKINPLKSYDYGLLLMYVLDFTVDYTVSST